METVHQALEDSAPSTSTRSRRLSRYLAAWNESFRIASRSLTRVETAMDCRPRRVVAFARDTFRLTVGSAKW
jgi:hypothetical protein